MTITMAVGKNGEIDAQDYQKWVGQIIPVAGRLGGEIVLARITKIWTPEGSPLHVSFDIDEDPSWRGVKSIADYMGLGRYI